MLNHYCNLTAQIVAATSTERIDSFKESALPTILGISQKASVKRGSAAKIGMALDHLTGHSAVLYGQRIVVSYMIH